MGKRIFRFIVAYTLAGVLAAMGLAPEQTIGIFLKNFLKHPPAYLTQNTARWIFVIAAVVLIIIVHFQWLLTKIRPKREKLTPYNWFHELLEEWRDLDRQSSESLTGAMEAQRIQREGLNQRTRAMLEKYCDNEALFLFEQTFRPNYEHTRYETVEHIIQNLEKYLRKEWQ
ncbi:hypothetical protein MYX64_01485 [Nitrospinae bacterium AH_259_B05_G02_I21]|nr:hypothetical protein [Nitrospinae bacterium AH_259_B05_G02_I21]MDA2932593.1 hypothetical protein [Nitrospinae bacterium AH-259-F20]